ncbi:NUDIX domain-containing protein [Pengzhenrongella frigida]|uniref:NUDIX hydrolase n=1 Tax=Pengzhenrongella frigida TaxID=1259133 RepID=A0A4Q5N3H6_9MICO|nr:NUDIX hydrolase [Cellulomonas sp. HLT2-17]RYV50561.1 NUDIX hydrolase [Cellulomonas sp. HLT2-17]
MQVVLDQHAPHPVTAREVLHEGMIWDLVAEDVELGSDDGASVVVRREFLAHPGAVAIIVLDDDERVLLQRQYRHPVRRELWEPPAGLLDIRGEDAREAAARELAEEADLVAARWDVLVDFYTSPGGSDEALRIFLARGLTDVAHADRFEREAEERDMPARWVPLAEAVTLVLGGAIHNPSAAVGILAASAARSAGWATLRPADAPWPERSPASV